MEKKMDELLQLKYLMFENENNVCWLDASIALIAHNKTFKEVVKSFPGSEIDKLISAYEKAISTCNHSDSEYLIMKSRKMLKSIQNDALNYLKGFLKFEHGKPDSAFCALLNFIYQDKSNIKEHLNVSWIWRKECSSCGMNSKSSICLKPIITLTKVNSFRPDSPSSTYICSCKSEQNMKLIYKELPPCLIFHFENGVRCSTNLPLTFTMKGREYQLTGIIILEKSANSTLNHFVTWIRNPLFNIWLECNDLNTDFASFSPVKPEFDLKDVYITVYEAFDGLHRIKNDDASNDLTQDVENSNVELINVSDEDFDSEKAHSEIAASSVKNLDMYGNETSPESEIETSLGNITLDSSAASNVISPEKHENQIKLHKFDCQDEAIGDSLEAKKGNEEATDNQEQKITNASTYDSPKSGASSENTSPIKENKVEDFDHLEKESKMPNHKNVNNVASDNCENNKTNARKKFKRKSLKEEDRQELDSILDGLADQTFVSLFGSIMEKGKMNKKKEKP